MLTIALKTLDSLKRQTIFFIEIALGTASKLNRLLTAGSARFRAVRPGQMFVQKYEYAHTQH